MTEKCFFLGERVATFISTGYNFKSSLSRKWPRDAHHPGSIRKLFWKKNTEKNLIVIQLNNKWKHLDTFFKLFMKEWELT
jgi:hypothetical protein